MPGPKLKKHPNLVLADRVIEALWALLKKRGRTKELSYRAAAFQAHDAKNAQGYLITHTREHPPWAVLVCAVTGDSGIYLAVAGRDRFEPGTSEPHAPVWEQRLVAVLPAPRYVTARQRSRQNNKIAELVLIGLTFGKFDPDVIHRISSLAPAPPLSTR